MKKTLQAWAALIRVPNLFSTPGDIVLGAAVAGASWLDLRLAGLALASALLYAGGMILNDCFDQKEDAQLNPDRPLCSGQIRPATAWCAGFCALLLGCTVACLSAAMPGLVSASAVSACVLLYDGPARKIPVLGFAVMGLCRSGNVLLGASLSGERPGTASCLAAAAVGAYIFGVCLIAHGEGRRLPGLARALSPLLALALCLAPLLRLHPDPLSIAAAAALLGLTWWRLGAVRRCEDPKALPPLIGGLIRHLLFVQAGLLLVCCPLAWPAALLLLGLVPPCVLLARRFQMS